MTNLSTSAAPEAHTTFPKQTPFCFDARIRFIDVDATGRIHNTSLFRYFESAETEFFRYIGTNMAALRDAVLLRVRVECEFLGAIRFDDLVTFELRIGKLGHASVRFDYAAVTRGKTAARGSVTIVCVNPSTERPRALPEDLEQRLHAFAESRLGRLSRLNPDPRVSNSGYLA